MRIFKRIKQNNLETIIQEIIHDNIEVWGEGGCDYGKCGRVIVQYLICLGFPIKKEKGGRG